ICNRQGCGAKIEMISSEEPVQMNEEIIELLSECADQEKLKSRVMPSGAGHDAMCMARLAPTGMIFIPCKEGISHNPDEYTSPEEIDRGIRVLKRAVERLANQ
nr:M20/M25/M40 family metallo-hydrolase [Negativicutes bacterium]